MDALFHVSKKLYPTFILIYPIVKEIFPYITRRFQFRCFLLPLSGFVSFLCTVPIYRNN